MSYRRINSFYFYGIGFAFLLLVCACDRGSNNTQTKELSTEENKAITDTLGIKQDSDFLLDAYSYGLMIVQYSELAVQQSKQPAVVSFAEQSAQWHKALNEELQQFAARQGVSLPAVAGDNVHTYMNELRELPADRFNARYLQVLQDIQPKMIQQYELASENAADPELRSLVNQKLPDLQAHAQAVKELAENIQSN